jgi:hypothetical protein
MCVVLIQAFTKPEQPRPRIKSEILTVATAVRTPAGARGRLAVQGGHASNFKGPIHHGESSNRDERGVCPV